MSADIDEARRKLAEAAMDSILGGVVELRDGGALLRGATAKSFEAIGSALHAGGDPAEVAVVCFAAASLLRHPEDIDEVRRAAEDVIAEMQGEKQEGT